METLEGFQWLGEIDSWNMSLHVSSPLRFPYPQIHLLKILTSLDTQSRLNEWTWTWSVKELNTFNVLPSAYMREFCFLSSVHVMKNLDGVQIKDSSEKLPSKKFRWIPLGFPPPTFQNEAFLQFIYSLAQFVHRVISMWAQSISNDAPLLADIF